MKKILLIGLLSILILTGCMGTAANKSEDELPIIGIIQPIDHPSLNKIREGFIEELAALGYEDGKTMTINYFNAQGETSNYKTISEKLVKDSDIIFSIATPTSQAVSSETKDIPILLGAVTDPVDAGILSSLDDLNNNIAGISDRTPVDKQLQLLLKLQPNVKKIGFLYNSSETNSAVQINDAKKILNTQGIDFLERTVTTTNDIEPAMRSLMGQVDALYIPNDNTLASSMPLIKQLVEEQKIPLVTAALLDAQVAGIGTIGIEQAAMGRLAARQADSLLSGEKDITEIGVELVDEVTIYINEEMCELLGISKEQQNITYQFFEKK